MSLLVLQAYWTLIHFDLYLVRADFRALHEKVRNCPVRTTVADPDAVEKVCTAVDIACIWYRKRALCLQRSAATACLLRRHAVPAQLVIGVQQLPLRAHAWVEVDGRVVNDKPYVREMYAVLDRC
jgi:hypothetical protein